MSNQKFFGLIPAAGHSQRMGTHKLLMPWKDSTIIDNVLSAWTESKVNHVYVVLRSDDLELMEACRKWPVNLLPLESPTTDMKASIQHGVLRIEDQSAPQEQDSFLIAPADLPRLSTSLIDGVVKAAAGESQIVVPWFGGKNGHPICFPWIEMQKIFELRDQEGLNVLIQNEPSKRVDFDMCLRPRDVDTPEDYQRELGTE